VLPKAVIIKTSRLNYFTTWKIRYIYIDGYKYCKLTTARTAHFFTFFDLNFRYEKTRSSAVTPCRWKFC